MGETDTMLRVQNLRKRYETLTAVDGVSFEIRRGEIFGLLGPNGAGKTTTISMIASLLPPTEGDIQVGAYDVRRSGDAVKKILGVVPQELAIYSRLTGQENLDFFGQLYGLRGRELSERAQKMLALVGLTDRADSRAETYSGGMKRRLNLAMGLMHNPQLLLLDEPTVGVDPQSRNHIFEGVRELNRQGLTLLYTSHYMEEVEALCDRVGIMDRGKLVACDTVPNLIAGMGGAVIEIDTGGATPAEATLESLRGLANVQGVDYVAASAEKAVESVAEAATSRRSRGAAVAEKAETETASESAGGLLRVRTARPNLVLADLVLALKAADLPVHSLQIKQPNLEDVFLSLTGKTLRD